MAISTIIRFCDANFTWLDSSENTLIYLMSVSGFTSAASSLSASRLSLEMSSTSSISSELCKSKRFLIYQVKSLTSCDSSLPSSMSSPSMRMAPVTSSSSMRLKSLENTSVSTAPSTSSTFSYVSFSPRWKAMHWSRRLNASLMEPSPALATYLMARSSTSTCSCSIKSLSLDAIVSMEIL